MIFFTYTCIFHSRHNLCIIVVQIVKLNMQYLIIGNYCLIICNVISADVGVGTQLWMRKRSLVLFSVDFSYNPEFQVDQKKDYTVLSVEVVKYYKRNRCDMPTCHGSCENKRHRSSDKVMHLKNMVQFSGRAWACTHRILLQPVSGPKESSFPQILRQKPALCSYL